MELLRRLKRSRRRPHRASKIGQPAHDLVGTTPDGGAVSVHVTDHTLWFLTSSCYGCRVVWERLARSDDPNAVVVTPSRETESATAVAELASPGTTVVMSSDGWHDYEVRKAPWSVVVKDGLITADAAL